LNYELRVVIWETKEVIFKDAKMSDIFLIGYPDGQKPQLTDTHWRSEDGIGLFNWRMKFPILVPCPIPRFQLQVWDRDILTPNDAICEANLNLRPFYWRAYKRKSSREIMDRQWIDMGHSSKEGIQGKALVTFEILTIEEAQKYPAGLGRGAPNQNPFLEEPKRPETSFNPLRLDKFITKVAIGQNKKKIMIVGAILIVILIVIIIILLKAVLKFF